MATTPPTLDAMADAGTEALERNRPFAAPSGFYACNANICTNNTEAVARTALAAGRHPVTRGPATDVRKSWPACDRYTPQHDREEAGRG